MTDSPARAPTPDERKRLMLAALEARKAAYSPYSKFRVGAALLSESGDIIKGANVENVSYGATICAERTALVKAVSDGTTTFLALAVTTDLVAPVSPCGICRQFIREFCALKMPIFLVQGDWSLDHSDRFLELTLEELLPHSFGPGVLEQTRA